MNVVLSKPQIILDLEEPLRIFKNSLASLDIEDDVIVEEITRNILQLVTDGDNAYGNVVEYAEDITFTDDHLAQLEMTSIFKNAIIGLGDNVQQILINFGLYDSKKLFWYSPVRMLNTGYLMSPISEEEALF